MTMCMCLMQKRDGKLNQNVSRLHRCNKNAMQVGLISSAFIVVLDKCPLNSGEGRMHSTRRIMPENYQGISMEV